MKLWLAALENSKRNQQWTYDLGSSKFVTNYLSKLPLCNVPVTYLLLIYNNELSSFLISKEIVQVSKLKQGRG